MDPEARSRLLIEHMAEALVVCELVRDATGRPVDYRLEEVNPAFERLVGVSRAEALGRLHSEVLDPADDAWLEHYPRVVASGQPDRFEHDSTSTGRWFDVRVFPMAGDRFIVLFNDITAQKQSDERLRRAADRHGFLLRLADALRSLADPEEVQATATRLLAQHLGVDHIVLEEALAGPWEARPGPDHGLPGTPAQAWTPEEIELIREVADRTWSAVARARAEAALRASEEEHRTLFAAMDQGVHICELLRDEEGRAVDFRFLSVNPAHERQTGIPAGRLVGRTLFELTPGIGEAWLDAAARAVETGQTVKAQDYSAPLGRWFDVAFVPRGGDRFAAFFENTTARKTLEVDLARLLDQEHRARMEAESATRLRDEFLAIVSHELRTPLAAILLWSRLLASGRIPGREREAMAIIERNAEAQRLLIEDLLDASRMIAGQVTLEALPRDLVPLVAEAVEAMRPAALEREVGLELTVGADAPTPGADPGQAGDAGQADQAGEPTAVAAGPPIAAVDDQRLAQVLRNLIDNALRYSERGGTVRIRVAREGDRALVEVRDTGRGIEPALLPHVFDRFRRGDDSGESHEGGLGLGLSIAHELVQLHGGTIEAASGGRGAGATFTVRLPIVEATTAADEPYRTGSPGGRPGHRRVIDGPGAATARAPRLRGQRILVVEDDPDTLAALRVVLESEGAAVTIAATGADALARLAGAEARFEALVSDLALPGEDGLALVGRVRAAEATGRRGAAGARTRLRTVALSAIATEEQRQRALRAGFDAWLARPVDETELLAALRPSHRPGRGKRPG